MRQFRSHGSGQYQRGDFQAAGDNLVIEDGVLVFHPETIALGNNVYIGHNTILKGYHQGTMRIGSNCWIGQGCFFHSAGSIRIGDNVGIGPAVKIITSYHAEEGRALPILASRLEFAAVEIGDDCDIGVGSIILPGVRIGRGAQIGAGAVVSRDVPDYAIARGVPARTMRLRPDRAADPRP